VLLLDEVIGLVLPRCSGFRVAGLPQVRFLAPVRPAEVVLVEAALPASLAAEVLRIGFVAQAEGRIVLKGNLDLQAVT
jgi:hypothetical protein